MTLDAEINAIKNEIQKVNINIGYNKIKNSLNIGTVSVNNYYIVVTLPQNTTGTGLQIQRRATEIGDAVKNYFIGHPNELKKIGSAPVQLALINSTGTAIANNINYVSVGTGSIELKRFEE